MTDTFSRNLTISAVAHALVLTLFFVRAVFIPSEPIDISNAIRVDVVDLPQKMTEEQLKQLNEPAPQPAPETKAEPPPKPTAKPEPAKAEPPKPKAINLEKTKPKDTTKAQNDAIAKMKAMSALDKIKQDVSAEKKTAAAKPATVVKGNQVSAGNSLTGLDKISFTKYYDELKTKVNANWSVPQWLADGDFKAEVQILIDERGYVTKKILRKSSGNEVFDAQVMAAIDASSPLAPPPDRLQGALSTNGIILKFPE